ncbi:MAG TPA: class F sortase [Actinomycetota bacterium]|nr:class F sortase [Actinomycetota bacterium]
MTAAEPGSRRRSPRFAAWGCGALVAGCLLLVGCQAPGGGPPPGAPAPPARAAGTPGPSRPVSVQIPAIGVDARMVPVGLGPGRTMEVPAVDLAGWYEPGPRPGAAGPAVLVGHVDSRRGPAVFFRLGQLHRGDRIVVGLANGPARSFVVERVERQPKQALPVGRIWNGTRRPVLRLITCGGSFDRATGHYRDNVIVYANLVKP